MIGESSCISKNILQAGDRTRAADKKNIASPFRYIPMAAAEAVNTKYNR